ncbi:MAG: histidine phosphatase family protein [Pseudomonadota bacterium]
MNLHLLLIRHAKAEPHSTSGRDFDRALSRKGQHQAEALNTWLLRRLQDEKASAWSARYSPALRTRQTARAALHGLDEIDYQADERIWNADATALTAVFKDCAREKFGIILVGHNPGMEQLLRQFTGQLRPVATGSVSEIAFADNFKQGRLVTQFRAEIDSV